MRKTWLFLFAALVPIAPLNANGPLDPSGYFFPSKTPAGFESLIWIELLNQRGVFSGSIRLKCASCPKGFENKKLQAVSLKGASISLRVAADLLFTGYFLVDGQLSETAKDNTIVLRGTLKQQNKETPVEFTYSVGD